MSSGAAASHHMEIQSNLEIDVMPAFYYSFNVCMCHRHENNTHNPWVAVSFLCTLFLSLSPALSHSLSFPLRLSLSFREVEENHVIIFIDNYQKANPMCTDRADRSRAAAAMQLPCCIQTFSVTSLLMLQAPSCGVQRVIRWTPISVVTKA